MTIPTNTNDELIVKPNPLRTLPRTAIARVSDVPETERSLDFYNIHTGERLKAMYWVQGDYWQNRWPTSPLSYGTTELTKSKLLMFDCWTYFMPSVPS